MVVMEAAEESSMGRKGHSVGIMILVWLVRVNSILWTNKAQRLKFCFYVERQYCLYDIHLTNNNILYKVVLLWPQYKNEVVRLFSLQVHFMYKFKT